MTELDPEVTKTRPRWSVGRPLLLLVTGISLYLFAPSIAEVFRAWDKLGQVRPEAIPVIIVCETMSFFCVWVLQRIALRTHSWFTVVTTQLAGNAFNRITPGGGTTGTAMQARMLTDAGLNGAQAVTGLTVQSWLITAAVVAMPIFALPAIVAGTAVPGSLVDALWIGLFLFFGMMGFGALLLATRRPVVWLGDVIERAANAVRRHHEPIRELGQRLLVERNEIRATIGSRWLEAVASAVGRWAFEYFALLLTLYAIGANPNPWVALLAFVAASVLGMIPLTPGGLGFVEAGLTALLVLSGITPGEAVLATLVFRLVSFWLPMPIGLVAAGVFRRRYPRTAVAPD